jgi:hypothetical protein
MNVNVGETNTTLKRIPLNLGRFRLGSDVEITFG